MQSCRILENPVGSMYVFYQGHQPGRTYFTDLWLSFSLERIWISEQNPVLDSKLKKTWFLYQLLLGKGFYIRLSNPGSHQETVNSYSKRHLCPSENNRNKYVLLLRKSGVMFRKRNLLVFTAIKSEYLRWFRPFKRPFEHTFPETSRWVLRLLISNSALYKTKFHFHLVKIETISPYLIMNLQ